MKPTERITRIASYVPKGVVAADIGTDHALLPVFLIREGICPRVIASDLHPGPLEKARSNVLLFGLNSFIEVRQGDGLQSLEPGEADVIVIAGMGGAKITDILGAYPGVLKSVQRLVLQPQSGAGFLRRWLLKNSWSLMDEDLVLENGRFYEIIVAGHCPSGSADPFLAGVDNPLLDIGPRLVEKKHPLLVPFLHERINNMESVLKALRYARTPAAREMRQEWRRKIDFFKGVLEDAG